MLVLLCVPTLEIEFSRLRSRETHEATAGGKCYTAYMKGNMKKAD